VNRQKAVLADEPPELLGGGQECDEIDKPQRPLKKKARKPVGRGISFHVNSPWGPQEDDKLGNSKNPDIS